MNEYTHGGVANIDATVHYYDSPGQIERYWHIFKKGFRHVAVTLHTHAGDVHVDPRMAYIDVRRGTSKFGEVLQRVQARVPLGSPPWAILAPGTCVSVVKACLGIRAWWVLTPYQLYKYIAKHGGVLQ